MKMGVVSFYILIFTALLMVGDNSFANDAVILLPNPSLLGAEISECGSIFNKKISGVKVVYPEQISLDIREKKITGIIFVYNESVKFEDIQNEINYFYDKWSIKDFEKKEIGPKIWRVSSDEFTISLDKNDEGKLQLIFLKWVPSKKNAKGDSSIK
ncbi:MAG: hypothetical protein WC855_13730 [Thermodesulfovibrionales bacterium]